MHPNEELVQKFYAAFQRRDAETMIAFYAPDVVFRDPVFGRLDGNQAAGMWRMLCAKSRDLHVSTSQIRAGDETGSAQWEAEYTFGRPGRHVHNVVQASFLFRDGKIIEHTDRFDFWRWARMALGLPGLLMGWSPVMRAAVQKSTNLQLEEYLRASSQ